MKRIAVISAILFLVSMRNLCIANSEDLPSPWQHQDIGAVEIAGSAGFSDGVFTLKGTLDIWGKADGCQLVWQTIKGDVAIIARIQSVELSGHSKGGLTIRESADAGSRHATMVDTPTDGCQFLARAETGDITTVQRTDLNMGTMPYWVKLVRSGDQLTGYESLDGKDWKQTGTATIKLPETILVGLVASSHLKDTLCTVSFDHVTVSAGAK